MTAASAMPCMLSFPWRVPSARIEAGLDHVGLLFRLIVVPIGFVASADDRDAEGVVGEAGEAVDVGRRSDDREITALENAILLHPQLRRTRHCRVVDPLVQHVPDPPAVH